jgi:lysozyme family protein
MTASNFQTALDFVWRPGFDSPLDGYHVTPGDTGGGTKAGVIEATWADAVRQGLVTGSLRNASNDQLALILRANFWGLACDELPGGIDFMLFNGRMMSGHYPKLLQQALGFIGNDVDGDIGPQTLKSFTGLDARTLIGSLHGAHIAYCESLASWPRFQGGWTARLVQARAVAESLISKG